MRARLYLKLHMMAVLMKQLPIASSSCSMATSLPPLTSNAQVPQMTGSLPWYDQGSQTEVPEFLLLQDPEQKKIVAQSYGLTGVDL